jgi:hypothetical protein
MCFIYQLSNLNDVLFGGSLKKGRRRRRNELFSESLGRGGIFPVETETQNNLQKSGHGVRLLFRPLFRFDVRFELPSVLT